jgi:hypothetical protein
MMAQHVRREHGGILWGSKKGTFFIVYVYQREIVHKNIITIGGPVEWKIQLQKFTEAVIIVKKLA